MSLTDLSAATERYQSRTQETKEQASQSSLELRAKEYNRDAGNISRDNNYLQEAIGKTNKMIGPKSLEVDDIIRISNKDFSFLYKVVTPPKGAAPEGIYTEKILGDDRQNYFSFDADINLDDPTEKTKYTADNSAVFPPRVQPTQTYKLG